MPVIKGPQQSRAGPFLQHLASCPQPFYESGDSRLLASIDWGCFFPFNFFFPQEEGRANNEEREK